MLQYMYVSEATKVGTVLWQCVVPELIFHSHLHVIGNSERGGREGVSNAKYFKRRYEVKMEFPNKHPYPLEQHNDNSHISIQAAIVNN